MTKTLLNDQFMTIPSDFHFEEGSYAMGLTEALL